jgi:hypothetical protein
MGSLSTASRPDAARRAGRSTRTRPPLGARRRPWRLRVVSTRREGPRRSPSTRSEGGGAPERDASPRFGAGVHEPGHGRAERALDARAGWRRGARRGNRHAGRIGQCRAPRAPRPAVLGGRHRGAQPRRVRGAADLRAHRAALGRPAGELRRGRVATGGVRALRSPSARSAPPRCVAAGLFGLLSLYAAQYGTGDGSKGLARDREAVTFAE